MSRESEAREVAAQFGFHAPSIAMRDAMMAFADQERKTVREAAAKVCDGLATTAAAVQAALELIGHDAPTKAIQRETAETLAAAIRGMTLDITKGDDR